MAELLDLLALSQLWIGGQRGLQFGLQLFVGRRELLPQLLHIISIG